MGLGWSGSGRFSNSLPGDGPSGNMNGVLGRTQTLFTVPPGTYGPLAKLVIIMSGMGTNQFGLTSMVIGSDNPHFSIDAFQNFSDAHNGGFQSIFGASGNSLPAWWDQGFWQQSSLPLPSDPSFWDGGFSVTANSAFLSGYTIHGTSTSATGSPDLVGTGTSYTTDLTPGQVIDPPGFGLTTVLNITDDTHLTMADAAGFPQTTVVLAAAPEDIVWVAALITFDPSTYTNAPINRGRTSTVPNFGNPTLLNTTNFNGLSGNTLDISFGPTDTATSPSITFDAVLTDPLSGDFGCVDALAIVQGFNTGSPPPYSIDMAGAPNWTNIGSESTAGFLGQYNTFSAMAHWTRPTPYDTSIKWTGIPTTPNPTPVDRGGFCAIITFPNSVPKGNGMVHVGSCWNQSGTVISPVAGSVQSVDLAPDFLPVTSTTVSWIPFVGHPAIGYVMPTGITNITLAVQPLDALPNQWAFFRLDFLGSNFIPLSGVLHIAYDPNNPNNRGFQSRIQASPPTGALYWGFAVGNGWPFQTIDEHYQVTVSYTCVTGNRSFTVMIA